MMSPSNASSTASRDARLDTVMAALAASESAQLELAQALIAAPSPNPPGNERAVARVASEAMRALGYDEVVQLSIHDERPNVVGRIGAGAPTLMLTGHLDTVPAGELESWESDPWDPVIRDGRLYGLGSTDMKGSVAAMIHAAAALANVPDLGGTVVVALASDEEGGSQYGSRFLADQPDLVPDAVIVGEPSGVEHNWEFVAAASRGFSCFRIVVHGTQLHSSLSDRVPSVNASVQLARVLSRIEADLAPRFAAAAERADLRPTVNAGVLLNGGIYYGIYPGEASFGVDVRTVPGMSLEQVRGDVDRFADVLRKEDPTIDLEIEWVPEFEWLPPSSLAPADPLVVAAQDAAEAVLGRPVPVGTMPAFTDGSYWTAAGAACVPAFGPGLLTLAHRPNEHVAVDAIHQAARIYAQLTLRYFSRKRV